MKRYVLDARTANKHFPGIGRYVSQLAQAIAPQLAADEQLILFRDSSQPSGWQLPAAGERVHWVETAVSPFSLRQQWQIPHWLRQTQATLYHSPYYLMPYRLALPTILTMYDLTPQVVPHYVSARARLLFRLATRLALRQTNQIISISEATSRDLKQYYPAVRHIHTIPLAPDVAFAPQAPAEIGRIRQQYQLPESYVLYFGINKPHKNLVNLVKAWHRLAEQTADIPLVVAGVWDKRYPQAKTAVADLGLGQKVRFLGPVADADVPPLLAGATLFVFPSQYEGFGLPVIEAMACGTAVACANSSSLPEVGGQAACYFDANDIGEMAGQIGRLLADHSLRQEMARLSLIQAASFSWQKTAAKTLHLYRQVTS